MDNTSQNQKSKGKRPEFKDGKFVFEEEPKKPEAHVPSTEPVVGPWGMGKNTPIHIPSYHEGRADIAQDILEDLRKAADEHQRIHNEAVERGYIHQAEVHKLMYQSYEQAIITVEKTLLGKRVTPSKPDGE